MLRLRFYTVCFLAPVDMRTVLLVLLQEALQRVLFVLGHAHVVGFVHLFYHGTYFCRLLLMLILMFKISKTISLHPRLMLIIEKQLFLHHNIGNLILLLPKLLTSPRRLQ